MYSSDIYIRVGEVISIDDPEKCGRIKVLTNRYERNNGNEEVLDYCYPLLPQILHVLPKVGEAVIVLFTSSNNKSNKYYIGPIISQPHKMQENAYYNAINIFKDGRKLDNPDYEEGVFCDDKDIAIYGRKGCEVILKENDIRLQCGVRIGENDQFKESFNTLSPAYLKIKYYQNEQIADNKNINLGETNIYQSTATLVADEINLLSNWGDHGNGFKLNNKDGNLISDEDMEKIIAEAHVLPFGDKLVDFLTLFLKAFQQHSHPYPNIPTILPSGFPDIYNTDLTQILSKHVRIN